MSQNPMRMIPEEYFKQTCVMRRDRRGRFIHPLTVLKRCERAEADFVLGTVFTQETFLEIGEPIETGGEE